MGQGSPSAENDLVDRLLVESALRAPEARPARALALRVNMPETGRAFDITEQGSPKDP
jgi:hypothetical protein